MRYMRIQLILEPCNPNIVVVPTEEGDTGNGMRRERSRELEALEEGESLAAVAYDYDHYF